MNKVVMVNICDNYVDNEYEADCLGLLSLATILKDNDICVEVIDFKHEFIVRGYRPKEKVNEEIQQISECILRKEPKIVCFYTLCSNYHIVIMVARRIKELNAGVKIVFGGPQATLTAIETMKNFDCIDVIGIGEGEDTILEIVNRLYSGQSFDNLVGVVYKEGKNVIHNGMPELVEKLDDIPIIKYDFLDMYNIKKVAIDVGRGCPFGCIFCSTKTFWKRKFRLKSPQRIVDEIQFLYEKYNIKKFSLTHDLFTVDLEKVKEFCNLLINSNINISWACSSRIDTLDEEALQIMSKSGCTGIFFGIETGSNRLQKIINKNLDINKVIPVIQSVAKYNIKYVLSFIYGFPQEEECDLRQTVALIQNLINHDLINYDSIQMHELSFFPMTEITEKYQDEFVWAEHVNSTIMNSRFLNKEIVDNVIRKNKKIFPQYFEVKTPLRDKCRNLDKFIMLVYLKLFKKFKVTYRLLLEFYNNDLLLFYENYQKSEGDVLNNISFYPKDVEYELYEPINSIKRFVLNGKFGVYDKEIKEVMLFEYDIIVFLHKDKKTNCIKKYKFDVYDILKFNKLSERFKTPVSIKFTRIDDKNINVQKYDESKVG